VGERVVTLVERRFFKSAGRLEWGRGDGLRV